MPGGRSPVGWERLVLGRLGRYSTRRFNDGTGRREVWAENKSQYGPRSRARSISAAALFDFQQRVREVFGKDTERCEVVDVCHSR